MLKILLALVYYTNIILHINYILFTKLCVGYSYSAVNVKVVIHVEMPKAAPKKSICHFQKLEMRLPQNNYSEIYCFG